MGILEILVLAVLVVACLSLFLLWRSQSLRGGDMARAEQSIRELVGPLHEEIKELEKSRAKQEGTLANHLQELTRQYEGLQGQTYGLVSALKDSGSRGIWGEVQLKRVVEVAGMVQYCDFDKQVEVSLSGQDGVVRPDLVVRLPGGTSIAVDAKAPGKAFIEAVDKQDPEQRDQLFRSYASQVADHVKRLSAKAYWERVSPAPEFVVMFMPSEPMLGAALKYRPSLLEEAFAQHVILATPTSLIAILRSAAFGWRQEKIAEDAKYVAQLANEMVHRVLTLWGHFHKVGRGLNNAIDAFNQTVGSFESRVRPSARKLEEHVHAARELHDVEPVSKSARGLEGPEGGVSDKAPRSE